MLGTSSSGPDSNGTEQSSSNDWNPINSRLLFDINHWEFKQACKVRRPDGDEAYGVWPLPSDVKLHHLMNEHSIDNYFYSQSLKQNLRVPEWLPVSGGPSDIHVELMKHGIIGDPSIRDNEQSVQCRRNTAVFLACA